jgi:hexosaminidase
MPWPQNITLTSGTFTITKQFKVNIKGNPDARLLKGD